MSASAAPFSLGYRRRLWALGAIVVLVIAVFWQRKLQPTLRSWNVAQDLADQQHAGADVHADLVSLRRELTALQSTASGNADERWQHVLDRVSREARKGARLFAIAPVHHVEHEGMHIHTLALSLEGHTSALLELVDRLERDVEGVHLLSLDLHTTATGPDRSRQLLATAYLQTITP